MDTITRADGTAQTTLRTVPIELIDDDYNDMRRVAVSARSDAVLKGSILRHGVLQAIGVRQLGNRYQIAFGRRRLRLSRELERSEIPAMVGDWPDEAIRAVPVAENLHRAAPHPIDVWHSVHDLLGAGFTLQEAAEEVGLDERAMRRMDRLSRLHPDVLKLIEIEMPPDHALRTIAQASDKAQAKAVKDVRAKPGQFNWHAIAHRCEVQRINRSEAIFDADTHPAMWDEDLFAQPDDEGRFSTADVDGFMKLQSAALDAHVEAERAARKRVQRAEFDATKHGVQLPKQFRLISTIPGSKPKRTECVFIALRPDGRIAEVLAVDVAAQKVADKARDQKAKEKAKTAARTDTDVDTSEELGSSAGDGDAPLPETPQRSPVSKAGLDLIAAAKTRALHDRLAWTAKELSIGELLRLVLVSFDAHNIEIRDYQKRRAVEAIVARQILPGDCQWCVQRCNEAGTRGAAAKLLQTLLTIGGPSDRFAASGDAAEWIGAAIGAGEALPRFDTEVMLAAVNGETLRKVATDAGIKATGSVTALRSKLIGALPNWRPDAAAFGAPGPVIEPDDEDIEIEVVPDDDAAE